MSNALAIATVTTALEQIVRRAAQSEVYGADVRVGRPDSSAAGQLARIYLYLYQVTPNAALRNVDLPSRDSQGKLTSRPQAALDLHYLLAFYGDETEQIPDRMMGAVIRDLHAHPLLHRDLVGTLVEHHDVLGASDLHQAAEPVRLTPVSLSLDDLSKLWSVFFQTPHAPTLTYRASVVLIDAVEAGGPARPVLRRGRDDRGVQMATTLSPYLTDVRIDDPTTAVWRTLPSYPAAQLGWRLTLSGGNLTGGRVDVEMRHLLSGQTHRLTPVSARADKIVVKLPEREGPTADGRWPAGIYTVQAQITRDPRTLLSNVIYVPLAPHIIKIEPANPISAVNGVVRLTLHCVPDAAPGQTAVLRLAGQPELKAAPDDGAPAAWSALIEKAPRVTDEPVFLRVDGAESMPFRPADEGSELNFDESQMVTIV
jgi:hypothetical protein